MAQTINANQGKHTASLDITPIISTLRNSSGNHPLVKKFEDMLVSAHKITVLEAKSHYEDQPEKKYDHEQWEIVWNKGSVRSHDDGWIPFDSTTIKYRGDLVLSSKDNMINGYKPGEWEKELKELENRMEFAAIFPLNIDPAQCKKEHIILVTALNDIEDRAEAITCRETKFNTHQSLRNGDDNTDTYRDDKWEIVWSRGVTPFDGDGCTGFEGTTIKYNGKLVYKQGGGSTVYVYEYGEWEGELAKLEKQTLRSDQRLQ